MSSRRIFTLFWLWVCYGRPGLASWQENDRPKISAELGSGSEDVFTFVGNASHADFYKLVVRDGDSLLVGARNLMYNLSATDLSLNQIFEWYSEPETVNMCILKGKNEENCQNYIRIIARLANGRLLICGTNSFKPLCREYDVNIASYTKQMEKPGQAICPYDPKHNSTFIYVDNELYTGTVADFQGTDPILYREPLQTEQYDSMSLNAPNFVNSLTKGDYVYIFFRETAVEYTNCGKNVFSRVARVCKQDRGGPKRLRNRWTSYLKTRLNCSVPGEFPFYFDEIQSTSEWVDGKYGPEEAQLVYGVFTTPVNSITGSAVCAFSLQSMSDAFEGDFKHADKDGNWLPVPNAKVPDPRPGQCVNDSRTLPDLTMNFIKTHSLMDEAVPSYFKQPVFIRTSQDYRFTQIVVDPQVKAVGGKSYDVLFVGTDHGKVIKVINAASGDSSEIVSPVVIEELQVFSYNVSVRNLQIIKQDPGARDGRLIVVSDEQVLSLPLHKCDDKRITSCADCIALQDPYCVWDKTLGVCSSRTSAAGPDEKFFYQNVAIGHHNSCPSGKSGKYASFGGIAPMKSTNEKRGINQPNGKLINITGGHHRYDDDASDVMVREQGGYYSLETFSLALFLGALCALVVGFSAGYMCGRKCKKDDDDNIPYPDTEYEYFEQRQNVNVRRLQEPKLLPQEEVTYAEPVLLTPAVKPINASPKATLRKHDNNLFTQFTNGENYYPQAQQLQHQQQQQQQQMMATRPRDHFGTLRSQREFNRNDLPSAAMNYREGFGTTRSVKKVYL